MLRFCPNRCWAFILALCLFSTCFFLLTTQAPPIARADAGTSMVPTDPPDPGAGYGDPDVPIGPGQMKPSKGALSHGGMIQVVSKHGDRPVGDGAIPTSAVTERLRLFLLGLRSLFLRI
jgi:hypothetical protein